MNYYHLKQHSGFSLVETLVAVSILLLVIVGPMTISSRTAKSSSFASEQVQAFFLAQEGLELAQKARDEKVLANFVADGDWDGFGDSGGTYGNCFGDGCGLEWSAGARALATPIVDCGTTGACSLQIADSGRSRFTHGAGTDTPFTRKIIFSTTDATREVMVRSVVTWRTGSIEEEQVVETQTYLYNIYAP